MRINQILIMMVGGVVSCSSHLAAQIAPQPPVQSEPPLKAEAPPPQPPRPVVQPPPPPPPPEPLPEYQQIEPGESEGRMWLRPEPTELLALGHNPLVDARMVARLAPVLAERRAAMTAVLLANPDNAAQMVDPTFSKINLSDPSTLENARSVLAPLAQVGTLTSRVNSTGLLNQRQRQVNQLLNRDYQTMLTTSVRTENPGEDGQTPADNPGNLTIGEMLFDFTVTEPRLAYGILAADLMDRLEDALKAISVQPATAVILREARPGVMAQSWPVDRATAARMAVLAVPLDERSKLLTWASDTAPKPQFGELPEDTVNFREMTVEERLEALVRAYAGQPFDWKQFVAN